LYTQCPDCSTVFRVTAEALRAAQGRVRCGICSAGFDALENLSEAPIARSLDDAAHVDTITVEELPGNEFIELSAAANGPEIEDTEETDVRDEPEQAAPGAADAAPEAVPAEAESAAADEPEWDEQLEAAPAAPGPGEAAPAPGDVPEESPPDEEPPGRAPGDGTSPGQPGDSEPAAEAAPEQEDAASETDAGEPWPSAGDAAEVAAGADASADANADADVEMDTDADAELDTYSDLDADADADVDVDVDAGPDRPAADLLDSLPDTALEFHGSADDLERLFVPAGAGLPAAEPAAPDLPQAFEDVASQDLSGIEVHEEEFTWTDDAGEPFDPGNPAHVAAVLASSSGTPGKSKENDLDRTDEYPVLVLQDDEAQASPEATPAGDDTTEREEVSRIEGERAGEPGSEPPSGADGSAPPGEASAGTEPGRAQDDEAPLLIIPEELRRGPSSTAADDLDAPVDLDEEAPRRWPFIAAAAVLALALGAQAVHHWRLDLARDPATGPWILGAYQAFGIDLPRPVDLASFELRQLGAASDPGQAGRIRVRASIVNHAPFAQPYPLLRLTLQDRFGSTIGARNLGPAEYLPGAAVDPSGLLGASQRADAEVVFVDPGREAVGFELDVCTEGDAGLRCSADLPRSAP